MTAAAPHPNGSAARTPLLETRAITKDFPIEKGLLRRVRGQLHAVDRVNLTIMPGTTTGVVGESGSGKSTLGRVVLRLLEPTSGRIIFDGDDATDLTGKALRRWRRNVQIVFQDPHSAFDPSATVLSSLREPIRTHLDLGRQEQSDRAHELCDLSVRSMSQPRRKSSTSCASCRTGSDSRIYSSRTTCRSSDT